MSHASLRGGRFPHVDLEEHRRVAIIMPARSTRIPKAPVPSHTAPRDVDTGALLDAPLSMNWRPPLRRNACRSPTGDSGISSVKQNRAISPREAALLQTFPQDYVFYPEESLDFTVRLIGNAVPPSWQATSGETSATT